MNREGAMYGNGRGMRGSAPQGRMMPDGRGMRSGYPQGRMAQDGLGMAEAYRRDTECDCVAVESTEDCGCQNIPDIPAGNRMQLLTYIDEVSFSAYDLMLYLDTHPEDDRAIECFGDCNAKRNRALELYEEKYGPLQYGKTCGCNRGCLKWVTQPWPWEGGDC